jgi:hypothetical protein
MANFEIILMKKTFTGMPNSELYILVHITFRGLDVIIMSSARRDQMNAMMEQTTGDRSSIEKPNSNCQIKIKSLLVKLIVNLSKKL